MKGSMSTDLGIITVNPEVIAKYAGSVAVECFGIVRNRKDIHAICNDYMKIQCNFIIIRNRHLNSMCQTIFFQKTHKSVLHIYSRHSDNLMSNVKYKVEEFTGMAVEKINIFVEGVRVID